MEIYTDEFTGLKYIFIEDYIDKYGNDIPKEVQYIINEYFASYINKIRSLLSSFQLYFDLYDDLLNNRGLIQENKSEELIKIREELYNYYNELNIEYHNYKYYKDNSIWKYLPVCFEECFYSVFDKDKNIEDYFCNDNFLKYIVLGE